MDTIGGRLRAFAKERYGTLKAFGEAVELAPSQMTDYVKDKYPPGGALLQKFAAAGLNVHWLLTGEGEMDAPKPSTYHPTDMSGAQDFDADRDMIFEDLETELAKALARLKRREAAKKEEEEKEEENDKSTP